LATPTPTIEFEDDFFYLVPQVSGTTRTKFSSSFAQRAPLFRGLGREKVALAAQQILFFREQASHPNIDNYFFKVFTKRLTSLHPAAPTSRIAFPFS
jgi:hypothetical protein